MNKIIFLLLVVVSFTFSQIDTQYSNEGYVSITMTGANDTADVVPASSSGKGFQLVSIVALSSAVDTVSVYTLARDGSTWSQKGLLDLTSNTVVTTMILSTTAKEFLLLDPQSKQIRFISPSDDGSTNTIIIQGKNGALP